MIFVRRIVFIIVDQLVMIVCSLMNCLMNYSSTTTTCNLSLFSSISIHFLSTTSRPYYILLIIISMIILMCLYSGPIQLSATHNLLSSFTPASAYLSNQMHPYLPYHPHTATLSSIYSTTYSSDYYHPATTNSYPTHSTIVSLSYHSTISVCPPLIQ